MLSYQQALTALLRVLRPLPAETLALPAAKGRVLATVLTAPHHMPPFHQALMDGYALRSGDTQGAMPQHPVRLSIGPTLTAGASWQRPLSPRQALRIMTGAALPPGADAVIKGEESEVEADTLVVRQPVSRGLHVQRRGSEVRCGTVLLRPGAQLTPQRLGLALALGIATVSVRRQPRLALVAPGDELLPPGAPWQPGKKWCSNLYAQELRAQELGCTALNLGIVPDTLTALVAQLKRGLEADILVILGASGGGDHDFAARAMQELGADFLFRGVATSPGRSVSVAHCHQTLLIGLPGSPWAAFVGFEIFVRPAVRALLGQHPPLPTTYGAVLATSLEVRRGLTHFVPVRLQWQEGGWQATPLTDLLSLARAETQGLGLLLVPPHRRRIRAGTRLRFLPITN